MEKYRQIKLLGKGSYGSAWLVEERARPDRKFVMKEIDISKMKQAEKDSALLEAQLLSRLRHPNIVSCVESFIAGGKLCIVMDWCERGDLSEYLNKQTTLLKEDRVLDLFAQLCLGLKHVHDRKILHRDLKTQNVFLSNSGLAKLGDFGVSKVLHATMELAHTAVGTPYYLSPEICENRPYNNKSDVWSLGCILYELCTLKHAFDAANFKMLIHKILRGIYPPISSTAYSKALSDLVTRMLQKNPRLRPSVNEILQLPLIRDRIQKCLSETMQAEEFNHTVLHKHRILDGPPPPRPGTAQARISAPQAPPPSIHAPFGYPVAAPMPQRGMLSPPGMAAAAAARPAVGLTGAGAAAGGVRPPSSGMPDYNKQRAVAAEKEREEAARRRAEEVRVAAAREKEKEREREKEKERLRQQERAKEAAREAAREKERQERKKAELRQAEVEAQARRNREEAARRRREMEERERDVARQNAKAEFMERQAQAAKNKAALYGGEDPYVEVHMPPNARKPAAFEPDPPPPFGGVSPASAAVPNARGITPAKEDPTKKDLSEDERRRAYWEMREAAERNRRNVLASNQNAPFVTGGGGADEGDRQAARSPVASSYEPLAQVAFGSNGSDEGGGRARPGRKTWDQPDPAEKAKELEELRRRNYQEIRAAAERNRLRLMEELGVPTPDKSQGGRSPDQSQHGTPAGIPATGDASSGGGLGSGQGLGGGEHIAELSPITEDDTAEYAAMIDQMRQVVMNDKGGDEGGEGEEGGEDEIIEEDMSGGYDEVGGEEDSDDGDTMRSSLAPILRNPAFQAISGKFLLDGSTLKLPNVTQSDSLGSRIEALRVFLEEKLGLDLFLEVYNRLEGVQEDDEDEDVAAELVAQLGPARVGYLSLVHQLIICEETLNTSTMRE